MVARSFEPLEPKRLNPNFRLFLSHYLYVVAVILVVMQRRPLIEVAAALGKEAGTAWTLVFSTSRVSRKMFIFAPSLSRFLHAVSYPGLCTVVRVVWLFLFLEQPHKGLAGGGGGNSSRNGIVC